jgi:hypothetical protein
LFGTFCLCGNTINHPNQTSTTACLAGCSGNINEKCGDTNNIYWNVYGQGKTKKAFITQKPINNFY